MFHYPRPTIVPLLIPFFILFFPFVSVSPYGLPPLSRVNRFHLASTTLLHRYLLLFLLLLYPSLRRSSNSRSLPAAFQSRDAFIVSADRETASRDNCEILIITRKRGALGVAQLGHLRGQITSRHRYAPSFVRSRAKTRNERPWKDDPPILSISFMPLYAALNNIVMQNSSR